MHQMSINAPNVAECIECRRAGRKLRYETRANGPGSVEEGCKERKGRGMKKISLEELQKESRTDSYLEQYRYICGRIESGKIMPVKSSPLNGKKPALHTSYWLVEETPDYGEEIEELQFRTVSAIRTDYYLKHPDVYREERKWVQLLNRFFLEQSEAGGEGRLYVSLNERSFQIWGREKFLQREQGRKILAHCGVGMEELRVYQTTEPLAYYSCTRRVPQTILILENKDTFYTMRRWLMGGDETDGMDGAEERVFLDGINGEDRVGEPGKLGKKPEAGKAAETSARKIFGTDIATVIYGAGKGILRSFEDFRFCVEPHINHPDNEILYFGDLDYEGIGIYERLAALFSEGKEIRPFVQAYEKMIEKAREYGRDFLPEMSENQNHSLSGLFFRYFSDETKDTIGKLLETGKYIPQEIVTITDY